ncbi:MAG TPA: PE domain-containing protein [Mycobacterium sp.]
MSYVKTLPEALAAAAAQLEGIGNSFTTESSAAAGSTTDVVPAASDEVSAMQAGVFSTYGQLYQTVSAQAQAIHQQFVQLLNQSSGSYGETEAANQAAAGANSLSNAASAASTSAAPTDPIESLAQLINGVTSSLSGSFLNSNLMNLGNIQVGNWASAASDMIGMGGGGLLTALAAPSTAGADLGGLGAGLAGDVGPAAMGAAGGVGAAPVLAGVGQGASIGALSVPPSWAAGAGVPASSAPVTLAAQTWTSPAPTAGGMSGIAGMPAVANGGRGGMGGFGAPRYGVKPKVMPLLPKPMVT